MFAKLNKSRLVKDELLRYSKLNDLNNLKKLYYENNTELGNFGGWMLLSDLVYYSCEIMSIELFNTLYELDTNLDYAIRLDSNPTMFYNCIINQNILFYNYLISHEGPLNVLKYNIKKVGLFITQKRINFDLIVLFLNKDNIEELIQNFTDKLITQHYQDKDKNNDKVNCQFIEYKYENYCSCKCECECEQITKCLIPISNEDKQYIDYMNNMLCS